VSQARAPGIREILRVPEIRAAIAGTFVIMLGFGILFPILPLYARSFGVGYDDVGLVGAAFASTRLLFDLVAASVVQRVGERATAVWGSIVVGVSTVLSALAPTFGLLVAFRAIGGAGSSLFFAALLAYMLRVVPKERMGRVTAVYYGAFNLGFIVGPPVGGLLASWLGLVAPFWIYAVSCFAAAWLYHRFLRDAEEEPNAQERRGGLTSIRWDRSFATVLVVNLAFATILSGVYSTLIPLFGREAVGVSELGVSLALALASLTELLVMYPAGAFSDRRGRKAILVPAFVGVAVVIALLGTATSFLAFMVGSGVLGLLTGAAGVPPAAMLSDLAPEGSAGAAAGAFRFTGDLGFVVGPLLAGGAAERLGFSWAFGLSAVPSLVAVAFLLSVPDTLATARRRLREQQGL
jgi:MFS family permease